MKISTTHKIVFSQSQKMAELDDGTVDLIVTSPPYPMIEMWDDIMANQNPEISKALKDLDGKLAFELMHQELDKVWNEVFRVVKYGGIVCINIGDATRTIADNFSLFSNHSRILGYFLKLGFSNLPNIIWRKQTNAPNKFMGSGMLPAGAYVTLEHEYILIFRKGGKRIFKTDEERVHRRSSSFFWEERNSWFSDIWDIKGTQQELLSKSCRKRSGAFPFDIAYRLINMFSVKGDMVLDPFLGIATTMLASMASCRNSIGYEIDSNLSAEILSIMNPDAVNGINDYISNRLNKHLLFVSERKIKNGEKAFKHINKNYDFPVMTGQETDILINYIESLEKVDECVFKASYAANPVISYHEKNSLF